MGMRARLTFLHVALLALGVRALTLTQRGQIGQPGAGVKNLSSSDVVSFVRELRRNQGSTLRLEGASSIPIAVMPKNLGRHREGLGSLLQYYRKSLSYALALGLPWVGRLRNAHDDTDYTEFLGLCQPLCHSHLKGFDSVEVTVSTADLHKCRMNGTFSVPEGLARPTLILIDDDDMDDGYTNCLTRIRDRFLSASMRSVACTNDHYETLHFRWGDTKTKTPNCARTEGHRGVDMSEAVQLVKNVRRLCPLQVKVMSEGPGVKDCFSNRFSDTFEYIDGYQSTVPYDLLTFACSTVLIGGTSSFSVLGALLTDGLVIAPTGSTKYHSLQNVIDFKLAQSDGQSDYLATALHKLAPCV